MKTLQIGMDWFPERGIGGLERYFYDLTCYLPSVEVEVTGLVTGENRILHQAHPTIYGFASRDAPIFKRLYQVRQLAQQALSQKDCALIASHFALYTAPILDTLKHHPLVVHFHGPWATESVFERKKIFEGSVRKAMEQAVFRRADAFVVLSCAYRDMLHQDYQVALDRIYVVPGAVETSRFNLTRSRSQIRESLRWPQDRQIIFAARRLSPRMGLDNLITAMQEVCHTYPEVLVLIAGKGALKESLQAQIETLGLTNHVQLLGYVPDSQLDLAYQAADLTIIPTLALEGFGLVVLESLAAGTPVLGTPVGGIPEILRPFSEDLVFAGTSAKDLCQGIQEVLAGERHLPTRSDCISYVQRHYTWPVITQRIKAIYEKVLHEY